ncbi:MAG: hypothetical protein FJZ43_00240 [Candidatus Staskawiczbacteria bacterium]|nr:hypothetical protein [Candidatus Staskawiczbacteria bacterium]
MKSITDNMIFCNSYAATGVGGVVSAAASNGRSMRPLKEFNAVHKPQTASTKKWITYKPTDGTAGFFHAKN